MCGIAGLYDPQLSKDDANQICTQMLEAIHHRGPDARGIYQQGPLVLGHNRLSIIDLSEAANQPMKKDDLYLIFNGEIYNYKEIKEELLNLGHSFETLSDSEVILAAYKQWGSDCVQKFMGMWAFVIWDDVKKELFASRDRFGIKPFYYLHSGKRFYFGSEYKALKPSPIWNSSLNQNQVSRGLQMGWLAYHDETYFQYLKALPAAHNLFFRDGDLRIERYWNIDPGKKVSLSAEEKRQQFKELFMRSITQHMRADVPVGSCLSGGLDSSAIVSAVQNLYPDNPYKTYSIYYDGKGDVDERPFINEVIKKYPSIQPHYYSPQESDLEEAFHKAVYHADVPVTGSSFMSQYYLMKLIGGDGIKVVLDGQGADEYLGGYMHSFYRSISGMMKSFQPGKIIDTLQGLKREQGYGAGKLADVFAKSALSMMRSEQDLYALEYAHYYPFLSDIDKSNSPFELPKVKGSDLDAFLYHLMFTTSLPSLLHYEDRNSMAFSIESRVPFLDHRLVEFVFSLNDDDKIKGPVTKNILRTGLGDILPEAITNRKDKKGFVTPGEVKWLRGPLRFLLDAKVEEMPGMHKDKIRKLISEFKAGDNSKANLVWRLCVLNYWVGR
jgi:asparagine synthase (glutamine-hydrolysing)